MPRYIFPEVRLKATRCWTDAETGRRRQKTKTFSQTINPFNKAADGSQKDRNAIMDELRIKRDAWLDKPIADIL